jgi:hypothetical protein
MAKRLPIITKKLQNTLPAQRKTRRKQLRITRLDASRRPYAESHAKEAIKLRMLSMFIS